MIKSKKKPSRYIVTDDDLKTAYDLLTENPQDIALDMDVIARVTYVGEEVKERLRNEGASEVTLLYIDLLLVSMLITGVEIGLDEFTLKSELVYSKGESR